MDPDALKQEFDGRPLLVLVAGLVVGLTAVANPWNLVLLGVTWFACLRLGTRGFLLAGFLMGLVLTPFDAAPVRDREFVSSVGTVVGVPRPSPFGTTFNLATHDRTWRVSGSEMPPLALGDRIRVTGVGLPLREGSEQYLMLHGVTGRLEANVVTRVGPGPWPWRLARAWRTDFHAFCRRWMAPESAALTEALCFDLNDGVDRDVIDRLKEIGTLHVVVASGLHVLVLVAAILAALSVVPIPRSAQILIVAAVLLLYCGATGLTPAVVRASLMAVVGMSAYLFRRDPDALSALGLSALIYLLWQPRQVYDPGFQLSFLTVGGIILFYRPLRRESRPIVRAAHDGLGVAWVAFAASAPLLAYYFGILSVVSLPANLLVAPAASISIVAAFAAHALSWVIPPLGVGLLAAVAEPMAGWILWVSDHLGGHPWSAVAMPAFSAYWLALAYGLLLLTWRPRIVQP